MPNKYNFLTKLLSKIEIDDLDREHFAVNSLPALILMLATGYYAFYSQNVTALVSVVFSFSFFLASVAYILLAYRRVKHVTGGGFADCMLGLVLVYLLASQTFGAALLLLYLVPRKPKPLSQAKAKAESRCCSGSCGCASKPQSARYVDDGK